MTSGATPRTAAFHCERAWLGDGVLRADVALRATDGVLTEVRHGAPRDPAARLLRGLVLPGFANVHSHAFHRALRGRERAGAATFWSWREQMYALTARLTPDTLHELATGAFAEMLCAGFTAVGEFHYLHHGPDGVAYADPNELAHAVAQAAERTGIRLTLLDTCYLEAAPGTAPAGVQRRFADHDAAAWAARVDALGDLGERGLLGAAVHSVRAVPPEAVEVVASWAAARGVPLHAHVSEQPAENEACVAAYGTTPTSLLAVHGALGAATTAVHATHLTDADRGALAASGTAVCVCPTTERHLGDGLVALAPLVDADVALCVGTDAHVATDPFEELRCLEGHERLRTGRRGTLDGAALLGAVTVSGHRALGRPGAGRLATGAPCDLVAVVDGAPARAGTDDGLDGLLAAAAARDVATVVVAGEVLVDDGQHVRLDVATQLSDAIGRAWS